MFNSAELFLLGSAGALAGETLKLYELRGKLLTEKYRRLARSRLYWAVFAGMVVSSGFIAWAVNSPDPSATALQIILSGVGARGLIHGFTQSQVANKPATLGSEERHDRTQLTARDIFA